MSSEQNTMYIIGQERCLQGVSYIVSKCQKLWCTNGLKLHQSFYPSSIKSAFYFIVRLRTRSSANRTQSSPNGVNGADASKIKWRRISNVNESIEIRSLVSRGPKNFKLAVESCQAALRGNTSLIATFSSFIRFLESREYSWLSGSLICNK